MKSKLHPVYIFIGQEHFLKQEALTNLRNKTLPSIATNSLPFNYLTLDGKMTTSSNIISESEQLPFLGNKRLIVVKDADHLLDDILLNYIKNPSKTTVLALLINKIDKRLSIYKTIKEYTEIIEFNHLKQETLVEWIIEYINSNKKSISYGNVIYLTNMLENNLSGIKQELDKLITYIGSRNTISVEDIEININENKIKGSFELTDAIQQKDTTLAISIVNNLLDQGKSVPEILGLIRWMITRLWQGKELIKNSNNKKILSKELRIPPYFISKFLSQIENFNIEEIKKGLNSILSLENIMRSYSVPKKLLLECLVIQLSDPNLSR